VDFELLDSWSGQTCTDTRREDASIERIAENHIEPLVRRRFTALRLRYHRTVKRIVPRCLKMNAQLLERSWLCVLEYE